MNDPSISVPGLSDWPRGLVAPLWHPQTYRNLAYILIAFALGIFYFTFLTTVVAVGIGTAIIWIGVGILAVGILVWRSFAQFERRMSKAMLGFSIDDPPRSEEVRLLRRAREEAKDPNTYRELVYLWLIRFPLDTFNFSVAVSFVAASLALIASPIVVQFVDIKLFTDDPWWLVDTTGESLLLVPIGLFLLWLSVHVVNGLARLSGTIARAMLR